MYKKIKCRIENYSQTMTWGICSILAGILSVYTSYHHDYSTAVILAFTAGLSLGLVAILYKKKR